MRKSLELKDWEKAQCLIREWEALGVPAKEEPAAVSIDRACNEFLADAAARELQDSTLRKYRQLIKQMREFATTDGWPFLKQWDVDAVRRFRSTWTDKGVTVVKKLNDCERSFDMRRRAAGLRRVPQRS